MNDDIDQLSETFAAHEHLAPDPADVLVRAKAIARSYQRRRWAVRATGGAVLGAGLVAGGIALPGRLGHASTGQTVAAVQPADGGTPTPSPSPTSFTQDQEWTAYFAAGYDYSDAQRLAALWHDSSDIGTVKAQAGLKLLEGQQLPFAPSDTPETKAEKKASARTVVAPGGSTGTTVAPTKEEIATEEFFAAGYDYNDAVVLAHTWHESDVFSVKAQAGQKLLDGKTLPVAPSGTPESTAEKAQNAFIYSGYTYADAVKLGKIWHVSDISKIKTVAGQELLDGNTLPIGP